MTFNKRYLIYIAAAFCFSSCASSYVIDYVEVSFTELSSNKVGPDEETEKIIEPYRNDLNKIMKEVLNTSEVAMDRALPEGLLGNFVADLSLKKGNENYRPIDGLGIDFCLLNNGGLRTALPKGDITRGKLFELMPFENELVVITLAKHRLQELFFYLDSIEGAPISGITATLTVGMGLTNIFINGLMIDSTRNYKVLTTDYLANGGDKMEFFANPINREGLYLKLRDAILQHVIEQKENGHPITSSLDNRLKYAK